MKVFVYGTLKSDGGLFPMLRSRLDMYGFSVDPIKAETKEQFIMLDLHAFPGVIHGEKDISTIISGEVYNINEDILEALDRVEGYPQLYTREIVETTKGDAWMYIFNRSYGGEKDIIPTGEWVN